MNLIFISFLLCVPFLKTSLAESGDCTDKENPKGRNLLYNQTLEVDPCGAEVFKKCLKPETEAPNCTLQSLNPENFPYDFIVGEYEPKAKSLRFALVIPISTEFFIYARASNEDGNFTEGASPEKLGSMVDTVFPSCNSYSCCDAGNAKPNVARRCKETDVVSKVPTKIPDKEGYYGVSFLFYPPPDFKGYVVFICDLSESESAHYSNVKSVAILIDPNAHPTTTPPPPLSAGLQNDSLVEATTLHPKSADIPKTPSPVPTPTPTTFHPTERPANREVEKIKPKTPATNTTQKASGHKDGFISKHKETKKKEKKKSKSETPKTSKKTPPKKGIIEKTKSKISPGTLPILGKLLSL